MQAPQQPDSEAVDDAGSAEDPVRVIHRMFYVRDAPDNMPRVEGRGWYHGMRVPRGVNPHDGVLNIVHVKVRYTSRGPHQNPVSARPDLV
jgi:hypothetical protein